MRKIAESTVRRLSLYLRFLEDFGEAGAETVSSETLAGRGGTTSAQVRKDLSFFGSFGKRGLGYNVPELTGRLREILGLARRYRLVVVGAGKIGSALVQFGGFRQRGFDIVAIFDRDPAKVGTRWDGLTIQGAEALAAGLRALRPDVVVIATPADAAQSVAETAVAAGVRAILNFAPVSLVVPEEVTVKTVNLAMELEALSYALTNR